ncbi:hypothetical protein SSBG_00850 [Streptomyces sp. SPB074]|nr:hypothetical protein SSBG_00850 [Streptomyces sp. SPB074]
MECGAGGCASGEPGGAAARRHGPRERAEQGGEAVRGKFGGGEELCACCAELAEGARRAEAVFDYSAATDCRVLLARHRAAAHGTPLPRA